MSDRPTTKYAGPLYVEHDEFVELQQHVLRITEQNLENRQELIQANERITTLQVALICLGILVIPTSALVTFLIFR